MIRTIKKYKSKHIPYTIEDTGQTYGSNTAVGHSAGYTGGSNINFGGNVYVGINAGYFHDGGGSTFIGNSAGQNYMTGSNNVAIGASAMKGFVTSSSTGNDNVVIGNKQVALEIKF